MCWKKEKLFTKNSWRVDKTTANVTPVKCKMHKRYIFSVSYIHVLWIPAKASILFLLLSSLNSSIRQWFCLIRKFYGTSSYGLPLILTQFFACFTHFKYSDEFAGADTFYPCWKDIIGYWNILRKQFFKRHKKK